MLVTFYTVSTGWTFVEKVEPLQGCTADVSTESGRSDLLAKVTILCRGHAGPCTICEWAVWCHCAGARCVWLKA